MRTVKWNAFLSCLCGFAVALGGVAAIARADVTVDKGSSILIFPKVIADGTFDTIIQIANTGNSMVAARCFYVNNSQGQCQETDFDIFLTKQQPTHWQVSNGRPSLTGVFGGKWGINDAGLTPGHVPPVGIGILGGAPFRGELKCVEIDPFTGMPWTGNHLKGEATIKSLGNIAGSLEGNVNLGTTEGDVSKYNAIGILGNPNAQPANPLLLDGGTTYNACPAKLILNHFATGAVDPVVGDGSANFTELTLMPCREDFENQIPASSTLQILVFNEFEEVFSSSITVTCVTSLELTKIDTKFGDPTRSVFGISVLGTPVAQTQITPVEVSRATSGVVGVAERIVGAPQGWARGAYNIHHDGQFVPQSGADTIYLPADFAW